MYAVSLNANYYSYSACNAAIFRLLVYICHSAVGKLGTAAVSVV